MGISPELEDGEALNEKGHEFVKSAFGTAWDCGHIYFIFDRGTVRLPPYEDPPRVEQLDLTYELYVILDATKDPLPEDAPLKDCTWWARVCCKVGLLEGPSGTLPGGEFPQFRRDWPYQLLIEVLCCRWTRQDDDRGL